MASPQVEDGYTKIANELVEALMKVNLSAYESRVLWFLFRKTYGWEKKTDWIALSQFASCLNLDRRLIHRAIKGLSSKQMIVIERDDGLRIKYGFQKDYDKWKVSSNKMTVINRDDKLSSKEMIKVSSKEIPTKEKKEKKESTPFVLPSYMPLETWQAYLAVRTKKRAAQTPYAFNLIIKELEKIQKEYGQNPTDVLNKSIKSGWVDVYPLKDNGVKKTDGPFKP
jgi:phage replication O-like protein O